jgi:hypothetical protein
MRASIVLGLLGHLAVGAVAQNGSPAFEAKGFNVTQALLDQGVEPTQLPPPASEAKRSADASCVAAVSCSLLCFILGSYSQLFDAS